MQNIIKESSKKYLFRNLLLISILITIISSCRKYDLNGDVVDDSELLEKIYLNAQDSIEIDGQSLILETELYRDFFPGVPDRNTRLMAPLFIVNTDSSLITKKFEIKTLYVINKEQIWISSPHPDDKNTTPMFKVFGISKDGPEWETGIYVDVIVTIEDLITSKVNYLIASHQIITRAE
jgi:hypothetical protein